MTSSSESTTVLPTAGTNCTIDADVRGRDCLYARVSWSEMDATEIYIFTMYMPVLLIVLVFGLVGNTLAYVVMNKEMRPSCSTICLKALAVADNLVLISFCLYFTTPLFYTYFGILHWAYAAHELVRPYFWSLIWFCKALSVYIILHMTVQRYIAICMPLRAHIWCTENAAKLGIVVIVIVDFIYNIPKIFQYKTSYKCDPCLGIMAPKTDLADLYENPIYRIVYVKILYFIIMFVFPLTILFVLNWLLISSIKKARRIREAMSTNTPPQSDNTTEKIIGVVIAFLVLETPAVILNIFYIFKDFYPNGLDYKFIVNLMRSLYVMSTINSCINFYIYVLVGRRFRRILIQMLSGKRFGYDAALSRTTVNGGYHLDVARTNMTKLSHSSINTIGTPGQGNEL